MVECPTHYLSSGLDLRVENSSPTLGSTLGVEPTYKGKEGREAGREKERREGKKMGRENELVTFKRKKNKNDQ